MAVFHFYNGFVSVNGVDLSDHATSISLELSQAELDTTAMSNTAVARIGGLKDASANIEWNQDFASGEVDATLWGVYNGGVPVAVVCRADAGAVSATNPTYTLTGLLTGYSPLTGGPADKGSTTSSFVNSSTTGVARSTS